MVADPTGRIAARHGARHRHAAVPETRLEQSRGSLVRPPSSRARRRSRGCSASPARSVSAYFFGVTGLINAFTVALLIPNLVRAFVADAALSGAFVPVFSELLEKGERQRAWRVASTLFWLTLLDPRRRHGALHPARAAAHAAVRRSRRRLRARRRALARPLPDRRAARAVRDRRRDPQHVPPLRAAGARAGRVERRDHRRARPRRPADRRRERAALPLRGRRRRRDARAAPAADPVAAPARRAPDDGRSTGATRPSSACSS